ncbi:MAG: lipopolysaccharide biosynthesis protein, partial [Planctomycetaceae bacterium]|nr:lipopolysaccharide biosynthesis protein [Planctomycetaceae bacterium]
TRAVLRDLSIASKFTVLFGGVLGYAQDLDVILDAAEALRANPDVQFLVLGDGPERSRLQAAIAERRLVNLHLRSLLEASSYRRVLGAVDIGLVTLKCAMKTPVVPSKTFGFFAAGLPVITAVNEESDLRRIIEVSSGGINVPAGDGKALAQAIELLWRNKPLAREYGNNGRRYGKEHFGVRQASLKYLTLLGGSAHYLARTTKGGMSS